MHIGFVNLFVFVLMLLQIDANVDISQIGTTAGNGYVECGEELILSCRITGNPNSMTWQNDSSNTALAQCFINSCDLNPLVAGRFDFFANRSNGIYNLIFNVTNDNNGSSYTCADGSNSDTSLVKVKDIKPTIIKTNGVTIKAMSGCIHSSEPVEFTWKKIKAGKESDYSTCSNAKVSTDTTACVLDNDCGGANLIKKVKSIEAEEGGIDDYYLKVIVSYSDIDMVSSVSSKTYKLKSICPCNKVHLIIIGILYLFDVILIVAVCIFIKKKIGRMIPILLVYLGIFLAVVPVLAGSVMLIIGFAECYVYSCCTCCDVYTYFGISGIIYCLLKMCIGFVLIYNLRKEDKDNNDEDKSSSWWEDTDVVFSIIFFSLLATVVCICCGIIIAVWTCFVYYNQRNNGPRNTVSEENLHFTKFTGTDNRSTRQDQAKIDDYIHKITGGTNDGKTFDNGYSY